MDVATGSHEAEALAVVAEVFRADDLTDAQRQALAVQVAAVGAACNVGLLTAANAVHGVTVLSRACAEFGQSFAEAAEAMRRFGELTVDLPPSPRRRYTDGLRRPWWAR